MPHDTQRSGFFEEIAVRNYTEALEILGHDFIAPVQAANAWGLKYLFVQLACLATLVPPREILLWARDNNCIVIPGPPRKMNLLDIRKLDSRSFRGPTAWYEEQKEEFSLNDTVDTEWLVVRKGWIPDSTGKNWLNQIAMLGIDERVPNAAQAAWAFNTYTKVAGENPFTDIAYVRTSSVYSGGGHVYVGYFWDEANLVVIGDSDDTARAFIGLASCRIF
ncbi:MAG: hypothetical protein WD712_03260 [Candidatus Spechtbacterales bacterium]